jgi:SulP family sulfate permease
MGTTADRIAQRIARAVPGLALFFRYPRGALAGDLAAGAAVALATIPSAIACAELIGLAPIAGVYAALGGMVAYALFGTAQRIIVAPDPAIAVLAGAAIVPLAAADPARVAALAAALSLLVGALLVVAARVSAGLVADLLSKPVLTGYLNGVALILIATQLPRLLGVPLAQTDFAPRLAEAVAALPSASGPTAALGVALVAMQLVLKRYAPHWPGALVACVVAMALSEALDLPSRGVAVLGTIATTWPGPQWPALGLAEARSLLPAALAIAFVAFAEGVVLARAFAATRHGEQIDPNRELLAFGAANAGAGVLGGFPVNASQSRSAIADASGAQTQLAQWVAAGCLVVFLLFLAPSLARLPLVALASVLIFAGISLFDAGFLARIRQFDRPAFWHSIGVTVAVLALGLALGLLLGIALSLARLVLAVSRPRDAILKRLPGDHRFHDLDGDQPGTAPPGVIVFRLYAPLLFANARHFADRVRSLVAHATEPVRCVVFDLQAVTTMDVTAVETFELICGELREAGIEVRVAHANRPLRELLSRVGTAAMIGEDRFFHAAWEAVDDFVASGGTGTTPPGPHTRH